MRAPAQRPARRPHLTAWAHPYTGPAALAVWHADGGDTPAAPESQDPPKPTPPPAAARPEFTQADLERIAAKEKDQGKRAGAKEALEKFAAEHGFSNVDDAKAFIAAARQAQEAQKTEEQKRREELDRREQALAAREAAAQAAQRDAARRAVLAGLGSTGTDLEDAIALLRVVDDAEEQAVKDAADALKERRPELFGVTPAAPQPPALPPAPGGAPASGGPARPAGGSKPGDRGREMARLRGHIKDKAA